MSGPAGRVTASGAETTHVNRWTNSRAAAATPGSSH